MKNKRSSLDDDNNNTALILKAIERLTYRLRYFASSPFDSFDYSPTLRFSNEKKTAIARLTKDKYIRTKHKWLKTLNYLHPNPNLS